MTRDELAERAEVPGRRPHPDPDRRSGARLRHPRATATSDDGEAADAGAARRRARSADARASSPRSRPPALGVAAVDLVPLALIRALAARRRRASSDAPGAEGIVSFGGGVTAIAVHEGGIPRFVRVLGTGGRELTDAIAADLQHPAGDRRGAEASTRAQGRATSSSRGPAPRSSVRCRCCSTRSAARSTTTATSRARRRLMRVVVTGGASQLPGLPNGCRHSSGSPSSRRTPAASCAIGDIGFPDERVPASRPVPARGRRARARRRRRRHRRRPRTAARASKVKADREPGGSVLKPVLGVAAGVDRRARRADVPRASSRCVRQEERARPRSKRTTRSLQSDDRGEGRRSPRPRAQVDSLDDADDHAARERRLVESHDPGRVADDADERLAHLVPGSGHAAAARRRRGTRAGRRQLDGSTAAAPAPAPAAPAPTGLQGVATFAAAGKTYDDVSAWLTTVGDTKVFPAFSDAWVSSAAQAEAETGVTVTFSSNAKLTDAARSHRLEKFRGGAQ